MSDIKRQSRLWLAEQMGSEIGAGEKVHCWCLVEHINPKTAQLDPSIRTIAQRTGFDEGTCRKHRQKLKAKHLIYVDESPGGAPTSRSQVWLCFQNGQVIGRDESTPVQRDTPVQSDTPVQRDTPVQSDTPVRMERDPCPYGALPLSSATPDLKKNLKENLKGEYASAKNRRTRATPIRCPEDFQPDAKSVEWIESFGVTVEQAKPAIVEFVSYWSQRSTKRADWQATFRRNPRVEGLLVKLKQRAGKSGGNGTVPAWRLSDDELNEWAESRGIGAKPGEDSRTFRARVEPTYEQERAK